MPLSVEHPSEVAYRLELLQQALSLHTREVNVVVEENRCPGVVCPSVHGPRERDELLRVCDPEFLTAQRPSRCDEECYEYSREQRMVAALMLVIDVASCSSFLLSIRATNKRHLHFSICLSLPPPFIPCQ